ncbi:hypothetical protein PILCRDRAFT_812366 [Piloderma croceum F 1598]|uniref:enoyl-[acyl-carrier-protein] reductase n=1 Tax=Piloderma croceum (strain F 1598) TaxID=765440 RepID=A0A0C3CLT8_PILCF|nr:hypothetical protein PILCRDRAFT_812366 [Piloderma croceum F 1598]
MLRLTVHRHFSTSSAFFANRAIVYHSNGNPRSVLSALTFPSLRSPPPNSLNIKYLLAPVNPADINVIEGVYPSKPSPTKLNSDNVFVAGNEGLAEVTGVGSGVSGFENGQWVVTGKQQCGTWRSGANVNVEDVIKVPKGASEVGAATITVNPATAYNMLSEFVDLKEGDWVIQNGANSAVGQAVIQIAASRGLKTINFIRNRENVDALKKQLEELGATHVTTYEELSQKSFRDKVKEWTGGKPLRLALNCVSGPETMSMARLLGSDAHLVSYGAMSKQPLSLPTSLFIFKNLKSVGYWQSRWYTERTKEEREKLMEVLVGLMREGKLKEPEHEIVTLGAGESDEEASNKVRDVMKNIMEGQYGKKVLLRLEGE